MLFDSPIDFAYPEGERSYSQLFQSGYLFSFLWPKSLDPDYSTTLNNHPPYG